MIPKSLEPAVPEIKRVVGDLVARRYQELEVDGRAGRVTADELREAVDRYGRTLREPGDEELAQSVHAYPLDASRVDFAVDVDLWTVEEGQSDLTLQLLVSIRDRSAEVAISDLRVL